MSRRMMIAVAGVAAFAAWAPPSAASGPKIIPVHGDPNILLVLTPNYLPDGKVEDDVRLVNRSNENYCFRFEVYDDHWVAVRPKVSIVTAPPHSAYRVSRVRIFTAGSKYRYKFKGMYLSDAGIEGRDCRKAFPRDAEY